MSMMDPGAVTPDLGGMSPEQSAGVHLDRLEQGKIPPDQANYGPSTPGGPRCDQCINFIPPDQCSLVAGQISPDGVSDLFEDENGDVDDAATQPPPEGELPPPTEGAPLR